MSQPAGAYVHIPFCSAICPYCDFAVVAGRDDQQNRYARAVLAEIEMDNRWRKLDSVYFGGGTPSRMSPGLLGTIVSTLADRHGLAGAAEISLEANPEDFNEETGTALLEAGFNRISFGAQSFDRDVLLQLGRRHGPDQVGEAVHSARAAGFENISVDLIYGTPGESTASWNSTLEQTVRSGPEHVSCYALTVEAGTPLARSVRDGAPAPDPDIQADRFESADKALTTAGLARYEVSNWSKPGRECVYNSTVWAQGEYVAYGNSAHRFRDGVRSRNLARLDAYLDTVEAGKSPVAFSESRLEGAQLEIDRLFVGLRRTAGVRSGFGGEALIASSDGQRLLDARVIEVEGDSIRVARPLLTDEVLRSVLALEIEEPGN